MFLEYQDSYAALEHDGGHVYLYAAKCILLFHILLKGDDFRRTATSASKASTVVNQFVFLQYYDLEDLRDNVDRTIGCIKLKWARTTGEHP